MPTEIEWTDDSWNPNVGCAIVSPGCTNCYAMRQAARIERMNPTLEHYHGLTRKVNGQPVWTGKLGFSEKKLVEPLSWRKPRRVFVNSMSDLFHENVPDEWIVRVFDVMERCPQHTFQILTKRARRMQRWTRKHWPTPLPNVWLGISAERQEEFDERESDLRFMSAAVRFMSLEPLLGPIDADAHWPNPLNDIQWVIVGAESGPGARPCKIEWVRSIRDQCEEAGVAFFLKQLVIDGKLVSLPELDGRQWREFPALSMARTAA
jgi:protein gp37